LSPAGVADPQSEEVVADPKSEEALEQYFASFGDARQGPERENA
jgi:hypothetical protein